MQPTRLLTFINRFLSLPLTLGAINFTARAQFTMLARG
jgi:hypothetical protein